MGLQVVYSLEKNPGSKVENKIDRGMNQSIFKFVISEVTL